MSDDKQLYEQKLQAELDAWQADIDRLSAKARLATADTRIELQQQLEDLKKKRQAVKEKVDELHASSGAAWHEVKKGLQKAWPAAANGFRAARDKFQ